MELRSIYEIKSIDIKEQAIHTIIAFNKDHAVFGGHFPGNPIVPGVVQIQVLKDLLENALGKMVFLNHSKTIKFLNVINPIETVEVIFEIDFEFQQGNDLSVKCIVKTESQVYMKFSGTALLKEKE
ncbi:MAG: hypothetical protein R2764_21720 [Bacteroidales bacterium]